VATSLWPSRQRSSARKEDARKWNTKTGKANFVGPESLATDIDTPVEQRDVLQLITLRAAGQFNTTIYNYDDRFRGIHGSRMVVLMHRNDRSARAA
jgi:anaerobic selenocysteine-containing dehydrogenase